LRLLRSREIFPSQLLVLGAYHPNDGSPNNRIADALFFFISDGATMSKHRLEDLPHFFEFDRSSLNFTLDVFVKNF
jgi:hypothetical protein